MLVKLPKWAVHSPINCAWCRCFGRLWFEGLKAVLPKVAIGRQLLAGVGPSRCVDVLDVLEVLNLISALGEAHLLLRVLRVLRFKFEGR